MIGLENVLPSRLEITDKCPDSDFQCAKTKTCLRRVFRCDGQPDCGDGDDSDEKDCDKRTCKPNEFQCDNGHCITAQWRCDKRNDCGDKSDERNCSKFSQLSFRLYLSCLGTGP